MKAFLIVQHYLLRHTRSDGIQKNIENYQSGCISSKAFWIKVKRSIAGAEPEILEGSEGRGRQKCILFMPPLEKGGILFCNCQSIGMSVLISVGRLVGRSVGL